MEIEDQCVSGQLRGYTRNCDSDSDKQQQIEFYMQSKGKGFLTHAMKVYRWGVKVYLHLFLTLELDERDYCTGGPRVTTGFLSWKNCPRNGRKMNIIIQICNKNQLDALFTLSLFRQSTSTCFGHIGSPSSGGMLHIYNSWYVLSFSVDCCPGRQSVN